MNDAEKLIATIKAVRIPQRYDLKAWEADAIYEDAKLDRSEERRVGKEC